MAFDKKNPSAGEVQPEELIEEAAAEETPLDDGALDAEALPEEQPADALKEAQAKADEYNKYLHDIIVNYGGTK